MNKTNMIILAVIAVYLIVIFPKMGTSNGEKKEKEENESNTKSGTGLNENADKNGVSQGASGQQKYRIGYTK